MNRKFIFKKISSEEFDKLKPLFPDTEEKWIKYRNQRLKQIAEKDIDVYAIEHCGRFIGEVTAIYSNHALPTETIPHVRAYFEAFRVDVRYRNKGLGQGLMDFAVKALEKQGYSQFTIGVEENNAIAKHIYEKFGFTEAIDYGRGDEYYTSNYTLYLKKQRCAKSLKNKAPPKSSFQTV